MTAKRSRILRYRSISQLHLEHFARMSEGEIERCLPVFETGMSEGEIARCLSVFRCDGVMVVVGVGASTGHDVL